MISVCLSFLFIATVSSSSMTYAPGAQGEGSQDPVEEGKGQGAEPSRKSAQEILELAAKQQGGKSLDEEIRSLSVSLMSTIFEYKNGAKLQNSLECEYIYRDKMIRSKIIESTTESVSIDGYDLETYWHDNGRDVTIYEDLEFKTDRDKIDDDIHLMQVLLRVLTLHSLSKELQDSKRMEDETGHGLQTFVVTGTLVWEEHNRRDRIQLWIDKKTFQVHGLQVRNLTGKAPVQTFCLTRHERNAQGLEVPGQIDIWRGEPDQNRHDASLFIQEISINTKIPKSVFSPPKR